MPSSPEGSRSCTLDSSVFPGIMRDAANDENFALSLCFLGVVPDQFDRATKHLALYERGRRIGEDRPAPIGYGVEDRSANLLSLSSFRCFSTARAMSSVRPLSHVVWKKFARCSGRMLSASSRIA